MSKHSRDEARKIVLSSTLRQSTLNFKRFATNANTSIVTNPEPLISAVAKPVAHIELPIQKPFFLEDYDRDEAYGHVDLWFRKPALNTKSLLLVGPCGCGKTAILEHFGSYDAYDDQDLDDFLATGGLKKKLPALLDSIESIEAELRPTIKKALELNKRRIVMTTDDLFSEPAKSWSKYCHVVKLERPKVAFILRLLQKIHGHQEDGLNHIAEMCNGNLAVAMKSFEWTNLASKGLKSRLNMQSDPTFDVPKATTSILQGRTVPCFGGTGDTSFLAQMLQMNVAQTSSTISGLVKAIDNYAFFDLVDSRHALDAEAQWSLLRSITDNGPKLSAGAKFRFEWPRTLKKKLEPDYTM